MTTHRIAVNLRDFTRHVMGVQRYTHEISGRVESRPRLIVPGRAFNQVLPNTVILAHLENL